MTTYTGYVYIWYDTRAKLFYVGGHKGTIEDSYVCSNAMMLRAYKKRPQSFRFRVLQYVMGDNKTLREAEQYWLDKIKVNELYWTPNIKSGSVRYYNKKKTSSGGNGSANKGKSTIGGHNKGKPMTEEQKLKISQALRGKKKSEQHKKRMSEARKRRKVSCFCF